MTPLPFPLPEALERELRVAYAEPPRAYHHFGHVEEVLGHAALVRFDDPVAVTLAILFHDAVYRPGRQDNEAESALLARRLVGEHLPGVGVDIARVEALVCLTALHGKLAPGDVDHDAALFLDCDMAILGAPRQRFDEYERAIRAEYAAVPDEAYGAGRGAFLERLLAAARIFLSDDFHGRLDAAARANVRRAIEEIRSRASGTSSA